MKPQARTSLACWPGLTHWAAAEKAMGGVEEPALGRLLVDHVQIVPQSQGVFDVQTAQSFRARWPGTAWRLHANVTVTAGRQLSNLCTFQRHREWFERAAQVSRALQARAYSAHAGYRMDATMAQLLDNAKRCADLFGCPVAIEGQYPVPGPDPHRYLLSTWAEYATLLASGVPMAIDLSHLNILACQARRLERTLVAELLSSPDCLEVHLSSNDGTGDHHQIVTDQPWWWDLTHHIHPNAVVFSEGNHRRSRPERRAHEPQ